MNHWFTSMLLVLVALLINFAVDVTQNYERGVDNAEMTQLDVEV